jgi:50S ribosomal protein L16 3-hydroxylase
MEALDNPALLKSTLGQLMTEAKYDDISPTFEQCDESWKETSTTMSEVDCWIRHPHARFAYSQQGDDSAFYCQGETSVLTSAAVPLLSLLCDHPQWTSAELLDLCQDTESQHLLTNLLFCDLILPS